MSDFRATVIACDARGCRERYVKRWTEDPSGRFDNSPSDARRRARRGHGWTRDGSEDFCALHSHPRPHAPEPNAEGSDR